MEYQKVKASVRTSPMNNSNLWKSYRNVMSDYLWRFPTTNSGNVISSGTCHRFSKKHHPEAKNFDNLERSDYMNVTKEHTPTPQELAKTFESLTRIQKLQLEAIMNMFTVLLVSVYQASKIEENVSKSKN